MLFIKLVTALLGFFEFYAVFQFNSQDESKLIVEHAKVLPAFFIRDDSAKVIYSGFLLMLGLQRLTWSAVHGETNFHSWFVLIITHMIECCIWYSLALDVNKFETLQSLIIKTVSFEMGKFATIVLLGVPLLCVLFTIAAVIDLTSKKKKYSKRS